jgi:hypothetical protein
MVRFTTGTQLQDCALAFGLPVLDDASFFRALRDAQSSDFLREQFGSGPRSLWRDAPEGKLRDYHALIAKAHEVFRICRASGIEVVEQATVDNLQRLFNSNGVVTLMAHWRGSEFRVPDVLVEPAMFLSRVEQASDIIALTLRGALTPAWRRKLASADNPDDGRKLVADFLNSVLRALAEPLVNDRTGDTRPISVHDATTLEAENRAWLEAWAPQWFQPGNCVELLDGLHNVASIDAVVPKQYQGILDLTVCRSVVLGEALKRTRPQMRILRHRNPVPVARALSIYNAALQLVANGWDYAQAMIDIHSGLLSVRSL